MSEYFFAPESAINQSWICYNESENERCTFLTNQQFNRTKDLSAYLECLILLLLALLTIPANIWAITRFKSKDLNSEFFILICALCCYNFLSVIVSLLLAAARLSQFVYPFGQVGCFLTNILGSVNNNAISLTFALISYERRSLVLFRKGLYRPTRTFEVIVMLVMIFAFSLSFWLGLWIFGDMLHLLEYKMHGEHEPSSQVCLVRTYKLKPLSGEIIFAVVHFFIPFSIIIYNYL